MSLHGKIHALAIHAYVASEWQGQAPASLNVHTHLKVKDGSWTHIYLPKIIHMSAVSLLIIAFVSCSDFICWCSGSATKSKGFKALVGLQHLSLTLIIVTGAILVVMKNFEVAPWFYAKVILFVLWSSLIKIYKKDNSVLLQQRRAGLLVGTVALVSIIGLVIIKPVFA